MTRRTVERLNPATRSPGTYKQRFIAKHLCPAHCPVIHLTLVILALLIGAGVRRGYAEAKFDTARIGAITSMLPVKPTGIGRPASDRAAWLMRSNSPTPASAVKAAQEFAGQPLSALTDDLYLDFSRTGNRDRCQAVMFERNHRMSAFTIAECFEHRGRFLSPLVETIRSLCAERTWMYPAHDAKLDNFEGRVVDIDLRVAAVAWELATTDYLLGDELPADVRLLIRDNVRRRVLQPFRDMADGRRKELVWLRIKNNWNAVCLAGVTGAALALETNREDRAWFVAASEFYIQNFLDGFSPDGYCSEGVGYWDYGFGHFIMLAETVREATAGRVDFFADPKVAMPASFAFRAEIADGVYPTISDCPLGARPNHDFTRYVSERIPGLHSTPGSSAGNVNDWLFKQVLFAFLDPKLPVAQHLTNESAATIRTWFDNGGVLICRPASAASRFAAVLKGGNNGEQHNHNDVGSFSVVVGRTMVLCDPGAEVYTARTFSARRYESKVINSYGHSVPVVAGKLQRTGADACGAVLRTDFTDASDTLSLDLRSAYSVPTMEKLERTFTYRRGDQPSLTVHDDVSFSEPQSFGTALITWSTWKQVGPDELRVGDGTQVVRIKIATGGAAFKIDSETLNEDVHTSKKPVRIGITLQAPVKQATLTLTITPMMNVGRNP